MEQHEIERELRKQPPRQAVNKGGLWGTVKPFSFILLPHMWIAIVAPVILIFVVVQSFFPYMVDGQVTDKKESSNRRSSHVYEVFYQYAVDNKQYNGKSSVNSRFFADTNNGDPIKVKLVKLFPETMPAVDDHAGPPFGMIAFFTLWCTFWSGIMFWIAYACCSPSMRSRALVSNGKVVPATVTQITSATGRRGISTVSYRYQAKFTDSKVGKPVEKVFETTMKVSASQILGLRQGETLTVLYDERNPDNSIIYKFGDYVAAV